MVHIELLDTAGQEEFSCLMEGWLRQGDGFLVAYSVTSRISFDQVPPLMEKIQQVRDVDSLSGSSVLLFGNKSDMEDQRVVLTQEGESYAKRIGASFMEGSALQRWNIDEAFDEIVRAIRRNRPQADKGGKVKDGKKKKCSIL